MRLDLVEVDRVANPGVWYRSRLTTMREVMEAVSLTNSSEAAMRVDLSTVPARFAR